MTLTKLTKEDQEALMRWPYIYGIPIFEADSINKEIHVKKWSTFDFNQINFKAEMLKGRYDNGAAVRLGSTLKGDLYATALDFDGLEAVLAWFGSWDRVLKLAQKTLVEWHQDKGKIHVLIFTKEPLENRKIHIGPNKVLLEIRCEKQPLFTSPSRHKDGNKWTPLGTDKIEILDNIGLLKFKGQVSVLSDKYMSDQDKQRYDSWLDDPSTILGEGAGRHDATRFKVRSYYWKYANGWLNMSDSERFEKAWIWHLDHCKPPRSRQEFDLICDWVKKKDRANRDKRLEQVRDESNRTKKQETGYPRCHNANKQAILNGISDENVRSLLEAIRWTMISTNPQKFIIADQKSCSICRGSITYSDSGDSQASKRAHLNYGAILIRLYPKRVILHQNPLKFLEAPPLYTVIFEDQNKEEIHISGTIETIISRLKEMPGYVVMSYGITEALTAIIGAFNDDLELEIDKSVEFEGYYYGDGDVQISRINLDEKHPRRTREEVIDCIKYLEERSKFQIWTYKDRQIDRRDLLASAIKWNIPAPFNFLMKQLKCPKPFLKGFDMSGERDGGKSGLSEEMLNMHGNPTNEQDVDSIYSKSAGSANTEAKFAKALSDTTYAVELSEFGRVESYGRREDLVECGKTAVDGLIIRRGKKDNRNDAPFPSLSPMIINGNSVFTFKGELLKRFHISKFSEEDRHERDSNSPFNVFQRQNKHLMKILGDWTIHYILDNKDELMLSRKCSVYDVGEIALRKFYQFGGHSELPEWLTWWIVDTSLEELDQDIESVIRSILYNHVNKTLHDNPRLLEDDGGIRLTFSMRIKKCLEGDVWPWIRKIRGGNSRYYINTSVLELFRNRLPDLTLKKLAEKTGFKYLKGTDGRFKILCTKKELDDWIATEEEEEITIT